MKQILDLDALVDRPRVRIRSRLHPDGRLYEMRTRDELSVVEHKKVANRYRWVMEELSTDDLFEMTVEEAELLDDALDEMTAVIMRDVEDQVLDDLNVAKKTQIVRAWMEEFYPEQFAALEDGEEPDPT